MRVSEILRNLADLVDQTEDAAVQDATGQMPGQTDQPCNTDDAGAEVTVTHLEPVNIDDTDGSEPATMVSPLQQEHELLKKSQGVDNNVAEFAGDDDQQMEPQLEPDEKMVPTTVEEEPEVDQGYDNDLAAMKKSAGIGEEQQGPVDHAADAQPASLNPRANAARQHHGKQHLAHTRHRDQK